MFLWNAPQFSFNQLQHTVAIQENLDVHMSGWKSLMDRHSLQDQTAAHTWNELQWATVNVYEDVLLFMESI